MNTHDSNFICCNWQTPRFGVAYYDEYIPYDRIDQDFTMMKEAGINVIRIAESTWSTLEPSDNHFDFSSIDRVLDKSEEYGLQVILGTPTYAIPPWLVKKHPDLLVVNKDGAARYGHRQNMDITHPEYLFHCERMIRALLAHVQHRPTIIGFQIDNETKHYDTACDRVKDRFVNWLKEQYSDDDEHLSKFNYDFGLSYWSNRVHTWEEFPDILGTINGSLGAEFERFRRSLVTEFLAWQADIIEEYRRPEQFTTQNFDFDWKGYSFGLHPQVNQAEATRALSVPGVDIYHLSQSKLTGAEIAFGGTIGRSLAKESISGGNYLVLETQAQGNPAWLPYPGQLRLQAYSHLGSGANSVMYWHWHSIHNSLETYWKGVLSHDFLPNATYQEAKQIGNELSKYGQHLVHLKKENKVAMLLNHESLTALSWFPIDEGFTYNDVVRWLFDACYRLNLECDFIYDTSSLSDYSLLLIPALYCASEETIQAIDSYVANGGNAIMTFKSAFSNERIKVYHDEQPHGLTTCFGMTYDQFTIPDQVSLHCNLVSSEKIAVSHWMELLRPTTASTLASYNHKHWGDHAAITYNEYGTGSATYLGCYFTPSALDAFLTQLCNDRGISLPPYQYPLIVKSGINSFGKTMYFLYNYSDSDLTFTYLSEPGIHLFTNQAIETGDLLQLNPWDFLIVEVS